MSIFDRVRKLNFPAGKYVVVAGGVLEAHGIREANDLDIVAEADFYDELWHGDWKACECEKHKYLVKKILVSLLWPEEVEIAPDYSVGEYSADPKKLLEGADIIDGLPFARLEEVLKWKKAARREKDIKDIELIDVYLAKSR